MALEQAVAASDAELGMEPIDSQRGMFRRAWDVFVENKLALVGLGFIVFIVLFCFIGPHLYVTNQVDTDLDLYLCHPGSQHLLGCNELGYDELGRLMVGGAILIEVVFNYPGMGLAFYSAALNVDYEVLLGFTVLATVATVLGNLLADIGYAVLDPRVRY